MPLFEMPKRKIDRSQDKSVASKSNKLKIATPTVKGGNNILSRINFIKATVEQNLGQYAEEYQVIRDEDVLIDFIDTAIKNKYISIDTETDGLDPLLNTLAGICVYTDKQKGSYIPLNHLSYITGQRAKNQLDSQFTLQQFQRLIQAKPDIDMFNAKFDIRFLRAFGLKDIYCTWDGYLASRILNENEPHKNLKYLHNKYCLDGKGDAFRFDDLFKGIPFTYIPPDVGYLYAAHDPVITTELCRYQRQYLREDTDREDIRDMYWVFKNIEMPCITAVADMEDTGILFDNTYASKLSTEYHKQEESALNRFHELLKNYDSEIKSYNSDKLDDPINISSPQQLAILFYDILKIDTIDKKSPRGTGVDILSKMDNPIAKAVLDYRTIEKLIGTYVDKLPDCVNPKDGRIHCSFNQYGADTGRMSSSDPNLQNIPSHNKDIRKMFVASPGYVLMSSDFSQQEPKCLAALCKKAGDSQMYDTFMAGKDLYSEIASKAFNLPYEECLEHFPKGSYIKQKGDKWYYATPDDYDKIADGENDVYKDGKARRTQAKSILLGVLYGRGEASIAEQLKCSVDEAKDIKNSVFRGFPAIKQFEQASLDMGEEVGYVTTVCGRKRRLPDLQLNEFEFTWKNGAPPDDDLLDFHSGLPFDPITGMPVPAQEYEVPEDVQNKYLRKLSRVWGDKKRQIFEEANKAGIWIVDNGVKIADARRQCVNARIQGSAADLTKLAMIDLNNNARLKELGFRLLVPVHDEVIAECPEENMKECAKLLAETMSKAAEKILEMPIKCDVEITRAWYGEAVSV